MRHDKTAGTIRSGKKRARGFTLLEVLVGATLLMVAMAGLVPFFIAGLNQSSTVRYKSTATNIAREKMEQIRQLDYREIPADDENDDGDAGDVYLSGRFGISESVRDVVYDIDYSVQRSAYDTGVLKEVTVTVTWTAPPKVSPVSLTTMFHQQYVGPRISRMEVHDLDPEPDSLGTPFDMLADGDYHTVYCYVAEADWGLVYEDLNQPTMTARDVYLKLARVDSLGNSTAFLDTTDGDEEIRGLTPVFDGTTGLVKDVYISYTFNSSEIPDGYWEFRAMLFNQYGEPGNLWRLRLRIENGYPGKPVGFVAIPQYGDESIRLYWSGSGDEDIDHYVIQRRDKPGADWKSWVTIDGDVDPKATNYLDQGSIATSIDPWGTISWPHYYQYRIWAVDIEGRSGWDVFNYVDSLVVKIPPDIPVTTTTIDPALTTTTYESTTTTEADDTLYTISVVSTRADSTYTLLIEPGDPSQDDLAATLDKKTTLTISDLSAGYYDITATPSRTGLPTVHGSFTLDAAYNPSIPVLTIEKD